MFIWIAIFQNYYIKCRDSEVYLISPCILLVFIYYSLQDFELMEMCCLITEKKYFFSKKVLLTETGALIMWFGLLPLRFT